MAYTKDYYAILGLPSPNSSSTPTISHADVRRAYKLALLAAHPDKQSTQTYTYTVDEVKEAYGVLSDGGLKREYDAWVVRNPGILAQGSGRREEGGWGVSEDFILGLELLDLSDFDVLDPGFELSEAPAGTLTAEANQDKETQMEWTRGCRCGADKGFRILEEELEDAESRGEKEVLVGCEGCSLWVRVGFEVEVEG